MTTAGSKAFAQRTVTGVVAGMVVAVAAATAVGFWLSYDGLHAFALHAGLRGPEAWAWPASVDLFIAAGEAGVTISALRRRNDRAAWAYLALGFGASVTANVLHVDPDALHWTHYAAAAVPPVAAMLALAALMRQIYQLAVDRHVALRKAATAADRATRPDAPRKATATRQRSASRPRQARVSDAGTEALALAELARQPDLSGAELGRLIGASPRTGQRLLTRLNGRAREPAT